MKTTIIPNTIDEYITRFPFNTQQKLREMRAAIKKAAPEAEEKISYRMPTFTFKGTLVHFAGYMNHIGFYPTPSGIEAFKKELAIFKSGKGSIQFPIDKPLPLGLITKIVTFRVKENMYKYYSK